MVKTLEDVQKSTAAINRLEELGIPKETIKALRAWLNKAAAKIGRHG